MPALTTRKEARERLLKLFADSLDRIIPADEAAPLRGQTFGDFEDQVENVRRGVLPAILEERAALEPSAQVECGGHCPFCQSDRIYLQKEAKKKEVISPHGPAVLMLQVARCRNCGRSFSPSKAGLGSAGGGAADPTGGRAAGAGNGGAVL
jgi:hypothetical protein